MEAQTKTVSFSVPGGNGAASMARRSVLSIEAGLPLGVRHRVALLLSELVANAVQHGGAGAMESVQVRVETSAGRIRVEVIDPGWGDVEPPPRIQHPDGGYGLLLVGHLSDSHGREATDDGGSRAWFEIDLDLLGEA
jgi:anti-sigma regulatory factor (Ser/Thr protein kinase)